MLAHVLWLFWNWGASSSPESATGPPLRTATARKTWSQSRTRSSEACEAVALAAPRAAAAQSAGANHSARAVAPLRIRTQLAHTLLQATAATMPRREARPPPE